MDVNSGRTPKLCRKVVQTLCTLGNGYWSNTNFRFLQLNKSLKQQLKLFECTVTQGTRLICQRCQAFSPRRTGDGANGIKFADFIRVWAMVRHYKLYYITYIHTLLLYTTCMLQSYSNACAVVCL
jgi:hypothetical protein